MAEKMWSNRTYIAIQRRDIALFKFLLEAHDNLGYCSVVDKYGAVLQVVSSPDQEQELQEFLQSIRKTVSFRIIPFVCPDSGTQLEKA
ncbi:MAG: DUF4911 domain-containing protein [Desulfovibrionales bacterium]